LLAYIALCFYMWATQKSLIFEPTPLLHTTPDRMGLDYTELHIPSGIGAEHGEMDAWWIPAAHGESSTLLYLHGNDRNIASNLSHVQRLHDLGYNVLLVDYRGFGKSSGGQPSEAKVFEDAEATWRYLLEQGHIAPHRLFIYGHSLGGAIAIDLAAHHPEAAGLIVESTFTSMLEMGERNYGYLPVTLLLNQRFESLSKIDKIKMPLLIIHGTWDNLVPVEMAQRLYAAAPGPKFMTLIEGGGHNNSGSVGWVEYRNALSAFIDKYSQP
jgi:pimeloyl-ACP methyl ester carboxylesterase